MAIPGPVKLEKAQPVTLDYGDAASDALLGNLSCLASVGDRLWTAADEGRTIECLRRDGDGFRLERQYHLDELFGPLVAGDADDEIDLEAMSFDGKRLWLCGSHCRVRRKPKDDDHLEPDFRRRSSRHLFGAIPLTRNGALAEGGAIALPFLGAGSLRRVLRQDPYLAPFLKLPSKEGGVDIEGLMVRKGHAFFGFRGPLIDSIAVIMETSLSKDLADGLAIAHRHFLGLDGLGIRDLHAYGDDVLVIAGPLQDGPGPFGLYLWRPQYTETIQRPACLLTWRDIDEKPEALCLLKDGRQREGFLILFDSPHRRRNAENSYTADWHPISPPSRAADAA